MLNILRNNPFPKFHVAKDRSVSMYQGDRRIPVKVTVDEILKTIPKRQLRKFETSNGLFTITTGVARCSICISLMDVIESDRRESYHFIKCMNDYMYRFYSGRTVNIPKRCGELLFEQDNAVATREQIIKTIVKLAYGIDL